MGRAPAACTAPRRVCFWLLVVLAVVGAPEAAAQQENAGKITRIAEIVTGRRTRQIDAASPVVQVQRGTDAAWIDVAPRSDLAMRDALRVRRYVDAQLAVDRAAQRGVLTFLAELILDGSRRVVRTSAPWTSPREAVYRLREDPQRPSDLAVSIERGALVIDWAHGRLEVDAAGTRSVITGTRLTISVDSVGDAGELFLETGTVSFPDFPGLQVQPGQMVRLGRLIAPVIFTPEAPLAQEYRSAIRYHGREVWAAERPVFWRRPIIIAPIAGVVIAAVVLFPRPDDGSKTGTVTVRFPR